MVELRHSRVRLGTLLENPLSNGFVRMRLVFLILIVDRRAPQLNAVEDAKDDDFLLNACVAQEFLGD